MTLANWRDLAVVLIAIEAFIMLLVPVASLVLGLLGLMWVRKQIVKYAPRVHHVFGTVARIAGEASQKVAAPVIAVETSAARARGWRDAISSSMATKEV